jgi:hypothetical protein
VLLPCDLLLSLPDEACALLNLKTYGAGRPDHQRVTRFIAKDGPHLLKVKTYQIMGDKRLNGTGKTATVNPPGTPSREYSLAHGQSERDTLLFDVAARVAVLAQHPGTAA